MRIKEMYCKIAGAQKIRYLIRKGFQHIID